MSGLSEPMDQTGAFATDDSATFDKLNQAVNSGKDLVRQFVLNASPPVVRVIAPVLVLPEGLLWPDYDANGRLKANLRQVGPERA
jgi:hypothetical protein